MYLASIDGCIEGLVNLLGSEGQKINLVSLDSIYELLKLGESIMRETGKRENPFCIKIENCGGLEKLEDLLQHENEEIYQISIKILDTFFEAEDDIQQEEQKISFDFGSVFQNGKFQF